MKEMFASEQKSILCRILYTLTDTGPAPDTRSNDDQPQNGAAQANKRTRMRIWPRIHRRRRVDVSGRIMHPGPARAVQTTTTTTTNGTQRSVHDSAEHVCTIFGAVCRQELSLSGGVFFLWLGVLSSCVFGLHSVGLTASCQQRYGSSVHVCKPTRLWMSRTGQ